jgi:hypothetical protein
MEQSPCLEANSDSASQEIHRVLWNPKVQYRDHKNRPLELIVTGMNVVHIRIPNFFKIYLNIILPSTYKSHKLSFSLKIFSDVF